MVKNHQDITEDLPQLPGSGRWTDRGHLRISGMKSPDGSRRPKNRLKRQIIDHRFGIEFDFLASSAGVCYVTEIYRDSG